MDVPELWPDNITDIQVLKESHYAPETSIITCVILKFKSFWKMVKLLNGKNQPPLEHKLTRKLFS